MAAIWQLADLDVTTSAFGVRATGQTHQLPLYDEYARHLHSNLVVLVFVANDYANNHTVLYALYMGYDPDRIPYAAARRSAEGTIYLAPPNPGYSDGALRLYPLGFRWWTEAGSRSMFAHWLGRKANIESRKAPPEERAEEMARLPGYESIADGWEPANLQFDRYSLQLFRMPDPPPVFREALEFTAFALDEFVDRTERDGADLVILASYTMGPSGDPLFDRMTEMAAERGIPVISQSDYVARQGGNIEDARFAHDDHWSAQGHQWAAEALLEWLRENPQVCDDADAA